MPTIVQPITGEIDLGGGSGFNTALNNPESIVLKNGNILVYGEATGVFGNGLMGQLVAPSGALIGSPFQLAPPGSAGGHPQREVAALQGGGFVVGYANATAGNATEVFARIFNSDGTPAGAEIAVNGVEAFAQESVNITGLTNGGFAINWTDSLNNGSAAKVRVYDASGIPVTDIIDVTSFEGRSTIGQFGDGFIVAYQDFEVGSRISAQRFAADGTRVGGEIAVFGAASTNTLDPHVTGLPSGDAVVVFRVNGTTSGGQSFVNIVAQVIRADGTVGDPIGVTSFQATGRDANEDRVDEFPKVVALAGGGFAVSWTSVNIVNDSGDRDSLFALFDKDGVRLTENILMSVSTEGQQFWQASIAPLQNGDVFASWYTGQRAVGRLFAVDPPQNGFGDDNANTINGGNGDDSIFGRGGNDTLSGLAGDDRLFGELGNDTLNGGDGNDNLIGADGDDTINGDAGNDNLNGGIGVDMLNGGTGDDSLVGGDGNDTLNGGTGTDIMNGGAGNDIFFVDTQNDTVLEAAGGGTDRVRTSTANYQLGANTEELSALAAIAVNYAGNALDNFIDVTLSASATVSGLGGNDTITGGVGNDYLFGGDGNDSLLGEGGVDVILGEAGNDRLGGGAGNDNLQGGAGDDTVNGDAGDDNVNGGDGNDTLFGSSGNDSLVGGTGNDTLDGGTGNDIMVGGDGFDDFVVDSVSDTVIEAAGGVNNTLDRVLTSLSTYTLPANIERFTFTGTGAINIVGNAGNNTFFTGTATSAVYSGLAGNDTLNGTAGNDTFFGGIGSDILNGNAGADVLLGEDGGDQINGGDGNDNIQGGSGDDFLNGDIGNDNIIGQADNDRLNGGAGDDSLSGNDGDDIVNGDAGNDLIFGNIGRDTLSGGSGADRLAGGDGDDLLNGNADDDILNGEAGNDTLNGGDGNDRLFDGLGIDTLSGGTGADEFRFTSAGNANADEITDFQTGIDKISFDLFDTDPVAAGVQAFAYIDGAAFSANGTAELRFENGTIEGDVDGDGLIDFVITVSGDPVFPGDILL